jgi:PAS domain-containing protein
MPRRASQSSSETLDGLTKQLDSESSSLNYGGELSVWQTLVVDGILLLLIVTLLVLGLLAALLSFFLLQNTEPELARPSLYNIADGKLNNLNNVVKTTLVSMNALGSFFTINLPYYKLDYYNDFVPYLRDSGLITDAIDELSYCQIVYNKDVPQFLNNVTKMGPGFQNFTIYSGLNNKQKVPDVSDREYYLTFVYVYPPNYLGFVAGLNPAANTASKNATIMKALKTGNASATDNVPIVSDQGIVYGVIIYSPVFDRSKTVTGFISGVFHGNTIVSSGLGEMDSDVFAIISDANATTSDAAFISNTASRDQASAILGRAPTDLTNITECENIIRAAVVKKTVYIPVADRLWKATFIATPKYISRYQNAQKWVGLSISLVIMFVLIIAVVFLFFYRKLVLSKKSKERTEEKVTSLQTNQKKLRGLLRKLASQDIRNKATIDIMPDFLAVTTATGKIVHTNAAFDSTFEFSAEKWSNGVFIGDILPKLGYNFYTKIGVKDAVETEAETPSSKRIPVTVKVRNITDQQGIDNSAMQETNQQNDIPMETQEAEAYVILMVVHNQNTNETPSTPVSDKSPLAI